MKSRCLLTLSALAMLVSLGCAPSEPEPSAEPLLPVGETVSIEPPLGLPPVAIPDDNPPTAQTIALGRKLYFDKRLSVDNTIACASCHRPDAGFADPDQFSEGSERREGRAPVAARDERGLLHDPVLGRARSQP